VSTDKQEAVGKMPVCHHRTADGLPMQDVSGVACLLGIEADRLVLLS